ncbi:stage II sporulation protein M [Clostridium polynesiense]|uniref:stage II sporulation protein M n=1 Tax=Clostridium polynesiense TaxID=1325933 RepID=UPI000694DDC9|nr:stage II sporulation protein M [Clostridium polynesiense]
MKEEQFIQKNSNIWKELEMFSSKINNKGIKSFSSTEIKRFLHIFRLSSHHLAYARTHYPQDKVTGYLNSLVGKCHNQVYAVKKFNPKEILNYIYTGFPKLLKENKAYIYASTAIFALGFLITLIMVINDITNAYIFLPENLVEGLKQGAKGGAGNWNYPLMSSYIMVNNITVAIKAFVFGITLGIGTIYVLLMNGAMLGTFTAVIYMYGDPVNFWSLILPHGVIELTAIFIAGAAGLIIGRSILVPGELSRKHALIKSSKKAVSLIAGIVFMLIIAGIIEGFFTPLNISEAFKLIFAFLTAVILALYFYIPYKKSKSI